jgi:hypothetical protein
VTPDLNISNPGSKLSRFRIMNEEELERRTRERKSGR